MISEHWYVCISQMRTVLSRDPVMILFLQILEMTKSWLRSNLLVELYTVDAVKVAVKVHRFSISIPPVGLQLVSNSIYVFPRLLRLDRGKAESSTWHNWPTHCIC